MGRLRITALVENTAADSSLLAEHGLSVWIEKDGQRFLFDTGQGGALARNAGVLGIRLDSAGAVLLSHGHYDHTGGLVHVPLGESSPLIYAHPGVLGYKFSRGPGGPAHDIGMPSQVRDMMHSSPRVRWTEGPTEVWPGFFLTGYIPRENDFEDTGGPFFADADCRTPDELPDDQAAFIDTPGGLVVLLGCAHSGVVNTLCYIGKLSGRSRFRAVMGGMHLVSASRERMDRTVEAFRKFGVPKLFPAHCTGLEATGRLFREFPGRCFPFSSGTVLDLEEGGGG